MVAFDARGNDCRGGGAATVQGDEASTTNNIESTRATKLTLTSFKLIEFLPQ